MEREGAEANRGDEAETSSELGRASLRGGGGGAGCRQNGLINTHHLGVEPREALLSVYSSPQYQVVVNAPLQQEPRRGLPQLLNPSALLPHQMVPEPCLRSAPGLLLCPEGVLRMWGESRGGDCCETTFIEGLGPDASSSAAAASTKEVLLFSDEKFLDFSGDESKIHTLSYDIDEDEEDDDFQELEVGV